MAQITRIAHRRDDFNRREWLKFSAAGVVGFSFSGWLEALAATTTPQARPGGCILLWMNGGPSQMDTFDLKPGHANGGAFKEIETSRPGLKITEHLPRLAKQPSDMALVRSMTTKEGDHGRATYLIRTGYLPQGPIQLPGASARWCRRNWAATTPSCRTSSASPRFGS